jgi:hypothetical protein
VSPDPVVAYIPPPKELPAFPDARPARPKTRYRGGLRKRWPDSDGYIYEWDYEKGTVEKYDRNGRHLGEFDADTGRQTGAPVPSRRIEP